MNTPLAHLTLSKSSKLNGYYYMKFKLLQFCAVGYWSTCCPVTFINFSFYQLLLMTIPCASNQFFWSPLFLFFLLSFNFLLEKLQEKIGENYLIISMSCSHFSCLLMIYNKSHNIVYKIQLYIIYANFVLFSLPTYTIYIVFFPSRHPFIWSRTNQEQEQIHIHISMSLNPIIEEFIGPKIIFKFMSA